MIVQHTLQPIVKLSGAATAVSSLHGSQPETATLSLARKTALFAALLVFAWLVAGLAANLYTWLN
jgi:hypothetical protein